MELFVVLDKNNFQFNWNMVSNFLYDAILFKNILKGKIPAIEESVYEEYMHKVFEEGDTILIHDLDATYDLSAPYIEQPEDIYDDGIRYRDFIHNAILREPRYLIHINLYDMYSKRFLDMLDSFGIDKNNIIIFGNRKIFEFLYDEIDTIRVIKRNDPFINFYCRINRNISVFNVEADSNFTLSSTKEYKHFGIKYKEMVYKRK